MTLAPVANAATPASEAPAPNTVQSASDSDGTFVGPDGLKRSITEVEDSTVAGVHIGLAKGDHIQISKDGQTAVWITGNGTKLIKFNNPSSDNQRARFVFSGDTLTASTEGDGYTTYGGCPKSKIVSWGWSVLWDGLVCVPLGVAGTPAIGFACGVAGSGIASFVPWDKVCK